MVTFAGVDHVSFTVSDLDTSQAFYTSVLDFVLVLDVGYGRILMHPGTGFTLSLMKHDGAHGGPFTELTTGLDHLGLTAASRADLEEWERRFDELGVTYTPIRDMEFGFHLNFRDPDNMALELSAAERTPGSGEEGPRRRSDEPGGHRCLHRRARAGPTAGGQGLTARPPPPIGSVPARHPDLAVRARSGRMSAMPCSERQLVPRAS